MAKVRRDDRDALLIDAMDLARPLAGRDLGNGGQADRPIGAGIDDQVADVVDAGAVGFADAGKHVDLAIAEVVARGHLATHLGDHGIGNLARGQAERGSTILVETDLHFRDSRPRRST